MPFARDDLDSNLLKDGVSSVLMKYWSGSITFVSIFGEDCMLGGACQGRCRETALQQ